MIKYLIILIIIFNIIGITGFILNKTSEEKYINTKKLYTNLPYYRLGDMIQQQF